MGNDGGMEGEERGRHGGGRKGEAWRGEKGGGIEGRERRDEEGWRKEGWGGMEGAWSGVE